MRGAERNSVSKGARESALGICKMGDEIWLDHIGRSLDTQSLWRDGKAVEIGRGGRGSALIYRS